MPRRRRFSDAPFGVTVIRLMAASGTTYRELGAKSGLSAGYLKHLVQGKRPFPQDDVIERLAKALDVEADYFREYRLRTLIERLEEMPGTVDRLYLRLAPASA
jgi:transcriptional regulator with XRE-family HTH domain